MYKKFWSPSAGRAWIEIAVAIYKWLDSIGSPSAGRAWIEIGGKPPYGYKVESPSAGRAWIEIVCKADQEV